ncbi:MAG TPA: RNA-binding cell elongation regulator Jag/EloR [Anaerolineales bacterium]
MNERTTLEIIAPTVEEAIAQGLEELGLTADAVSVEVLDAGSKGFFGLGKHQVRVRLTVNQAGREPAQPTESRPASKPEAVVESVRESESAPESDPLLDRAEAVISRLLHLLNLEAQVSAHYGERDREGRRSVNVDIRGNDLSILIGRRSETLNAFQYIASLIVGKEMQDWVQLVIDVEGYRDRREKQLIQMATRMAEQVAKSGRRQTLEPMPSAERRIIHIALRDHPDVITESTGEDPHRKVTIVPKNI